MMPPRRPRPAPAQSSSSSSGRQRVRGFLQQRGLLSDDVDAIFATAPVSPGLHRDRSRSRDDHEGLQQGGEELADGGELQYDGEQGGNKQRHRRKKPGKRRRKYVAGLYKTLRGFTQLLLEAINTEDQELIGHAIQESQNDCHEILETSMDFRDIMAKQKRDVERYREVLAYCRDMLASGTYCDAAARNAHHSHAVAGEDLDDVDASGAWPDAGDDANVDDDRKPILVLGMMKTGTNLIVKALKKMGFIRLDGRALWKHQPGIVTIDSDVVPIVAIREPLSWLASVRRTRDVYTEYKWAMPFASHHGLRSKHWWILSPMTIAGQSYANIMACLREELELVRSGTKVSRQFCVIDCQRLVADQAKELRDFCLAANIRCSGEIVITTKHHAKTKELFDPENYMTEELQHLDLRKEEIEIIFQGDLHGWLGLYEAFGWPWPLPGLEF